MGLNVATLAATMVAMTGMPQQCAVVDNIHRVGSWNDGRAVRTATFVRRGPHIVWRRKVPRVARIASRLAGTRMAKAWWCQGVRM